MTTREEIDAAVDACNRIHGGADSVVITSAYDCDSPYHEDVEFDIVEDAINVATMLRTLLSERAERQRRIEALTHALFGSHSKTHDELRDIITRCLDGDHT